MTDLATIKQAIEITTNKEGIQIAHLPVDLLNELLSIAQVEPARIPHHEQVLAVLDWWDTQPNDQTPEWWAEFDKSMAENRVNFSERDLGFDEA